MLVTQRLLIINKIYIVEENTKRYIAERCPPNTGKLSPQKNY